MGTCILLAALGLLSFAAESAGRLSHVEPASPADAAPANNAVVRNESGRLVRHELFTSQHVDPRNVDVWLPPGYGRTESRRYPVLYLHDGQNLFDPADSPTKVDWGVDETMTRLVREGAVRAAIVVGVWNTPRRFLEYMPKRPLMGRTLSGDLLGPASVTPDQLLSDRYLRFLVEELKPFIDANYRTLTGRDDTLIMGSSLGGLISCYALSEYPAVFGGAGCISTHWPIGGGMAIDYFADHFPKPSGHRIYFDHGTLMLDQYYESYQKRMDAAMRRLGYREGVDFLSRKYEGAEHNEAAWRARVDVPLRFLLGPPAGRDDQSTRAAGEK